MQSSRNILFADKPFFCKMLVSCFSSNMFLYFEKNLVEKLYKILEMELKTYTPVSSKFVLEKMKFKVLLYIQHDFIRQLPGFSKLYLSYQVYQTSYRKIKCGWLNFREVQNGYHQGFQYLIVSVHFFMKWQR